LTRDKCCVVLKKSAKGEKMKLTKRKNAHYLLIKLNARDRKYLQGFKKHETAKQIKDADKHFGDTFALIIKAFYVANVAMVLEANGKINKKKADQVFHELDRTMDSHARVVNKYFRKLGDILCEKPKSRKRKRV
jgi:hypothetical protein